MLGSIDRLNTAKRTVTEMLQDRHYDIVFNSDVDTKKDLDNFKSTKVIGERNGTRIHAYFVFGEFSGEKIGIKKANELLDDIQNPSSDSDSDSDSDTEERDVVTHCIIVSDEGYTPSASKRFKSVIPNLEIETFMVDELLYNLTKHECQPKKIELIEDPKLIQSVYTTFGINKKTNMKICTPDPVNRYFNGKPGGMYKVDYVTIVK
jgi:DNA-directed RNA polymerase subunit H (RpoH/RPB5)